MHLTDRFDDVFSPAADLPPGHAVVPHLAALDLDADDAGALDRHHEVDLVVLEVVGHPLPGDQQVAGAELLGERLPDHAFGVVGQPRGPLGCDRHAYSPSRHDRLRGGYRKGPTPTVGRPYVPAPSEQGRLGV